MQKSVLNKQATFGVKILWRYIDMAIFVLRCFILTHPVYAITKWRRRTVQYFCTGSVLNNFSVTVIKCQPVSVFQNELQ